MGAVGRTVRSANLSTCVALGEEDRSENQDDDADDDAPLVACALFDTASPSRQSSRAIDSPRWKSSAEAP